MTNRCVFKKYDGMWSWNSYERDENGLWENLSGMDGFDDNSFPQELDDFLSLKGELGETSFIFGFSGEPRYINEKLNHSLVNNANCSGWSEIKCCSIKIPFNNNSHKRKTVRAVEDFINEHGNLCWVVKTSDLADTIAREDNDGVDAIFEELY